MSMESSDAQMLKPTHPDVKRLSPKSFGSQGVVCGDQLCQPGMDDRFIGSKALVGPDATPAMDVEEDQRIKYLDQHDDSTPTTKLRGPVPTYGSIESILPDNRFKTLVVSPGKEHLVTFAPGQVFWMGKKRTMFQTTDESGQIVSGEQQRGDCLTPFIQVRPAASTHFARMEVIAGTQRYVVMRGEVKDSDIYFFNFGGERIGLPYFSLDRFLEQIR